MIAKDDTFYLEFYPNCKIYLLFRFTNFVFIGEVSEKKSLNDLKRMCYIPLFLIYFMACFNFF